MAAPRTDLMILIVMVSFALARTGQALFTHVAWRALMKGGTSQWKLNAVALFGTVGAGTTFVLVVRTMQAVDLMDNWYAVAAEGGTLAYTAVVCFQAVSHMLTVTLRKREEVPF